MDTQYNILVVEDEEAIREGLADVLVYHGYGVECSASGDDGLQKALTGKYDLVLLDIMMPGMDGYQVCESIREQDRQQAIIMLTAKSSDDEIIHGLKLGADDYVGKPFSIQQLVLRIEAVLRRTTGTIAREEIQLANGNIDVANLAGTIDDEEVAFTRREMDLLCHLAAHSDRAVSREELLLKVWGYARNLEIETRTVDIHIAKLRRKIESDPKSPANLLTIRGAGYRLACES